MIGRWDKIKCKENGAVEIEIKWCEEGDNDNDIHIHRQVVRKRLVRQIDR